MCHLPMSGKDRRGAPIDHLCLHFTGGKTHLKSESTPYTYRSGGPNGHLAIWTCKVHLISCMDITSCLSFRFSARKTWGMHTIMLARDGYIYISLYIGTVCLDYLLVGTFWVTWLTCTWRIIKSCIFSLEDFAVVANPWMWLNIETS